MKKYLVLLVLVYSSAHANFLPRNNIKIQALNKTSDEALRLKYRPIVDELLELYTPDIEGYNAQLIFNFDFTSSTVNAFAKQSGNNNEYWHITFLGGLMRHKYLTENVFAAVLCHELGHHLGGAPKKESNHWATVEGQSDYFAANECLKRLLNQGIALSPDTSNLKTIIKEQCKNSFKDLKHFNTCLESSSISTEVGSFIHKMKQGRRGQRGRKPNINNRDNTHVTRTLIKHPNAQCRLDTFFEGSLCSDYYQSNGQNNPNCPDTRIKYRGSRPSCWYSPIKE
jgi:hypothetical protein